MCAFVSVCACVRVGETTTNPVENSCSTITVYSPLCYSKECNSISFFAAKKIVIFQGCTKR